MIISKHARCDKVVEDCDNDTSNAETVDGGDNRCDCEERDGNLKIKVTRTRNALRKLLIIINI